MAKVKKMAFGGMGSMFAPKPPTGPSRGALGGNQPPAGANLMQKYNGPTQGLGSIAQSPLAALANKEASRTGTAAAGSPAGGVPDYAKPYMAQGSQLPNYAKPYMAQAGQPSNVPDYAKAFMPKTGQPTGLPSASAPALQGLGGLGAGMKKGGKVKAKAYAKGGTVSSASKRGDGIAQRGKTKGRMV